MLWLRTIRRQSEITTFLVQTGELTRNKRKRYLHNTAEAIAKDLEQCTTALVSGIGACHFCVGSEGQRIVYLPPKLRELLAGKRDWRVIPIFRDQDIAELRRVTISIMQK